jgi:hypothetical protein
MDYITVYDTDIVAINLGEGENERSNIIYQDESGNHHEIDFSTCALNYKAEHDNASHSCIGERNIDEGYFLFYTSGIKTKIIFKKRYIFNVFHHHLLKGGKTARFHSLQNLIHQTNFTTYDLI